MRYGADGALRSDEKRSFSTVAWMSVGARADSRADRLETATVVERRHPAIGGTRSARTSAHPLRQHGDAERAERDAHRRAFASSRACSSAALSAVRLRRRDRRACFDRRRRHRIADREPGDRRRNRQRLAFLLVAARRSRDVEPIDANRACRRARAPAETSACRAGPTRRESRRAACERLRRPDAAGRVLASCNQTRALRATSPRYDASSALAITSSLPSNSRGRMARIAESAMCCSCGILSRRGDRRALTRQRRAFGRAVDRAHRRARPDTVERPR